jgi:hypothetical protein
LMGRQTLPALVAGANKVLHQTPSRQQSCKRAATCGSAEDARNLLSDGGQTVFERIPDARVVQPPHRAPSF